MAKVQIFVFVLALSQVYGSVVISTLPGVLETVPETRPEFVPELRPELLPEVPEVVSLPCVATVRALLETILKQLPVVEVPGPHQAPEIVLLPDTPIVEGPIVEATPLPETPCSACFEHINSLLITAEKAVAVRRMAQYLRL